MPAVSIRNRIAQILLESDVPLNADEILARWPVRRAPTQMRVSNLLSSYSEFVRTKWWKENSRNQKEYTHMDHSLLSMAEEE